MIRRATERSLRSFSIPLMLLAAVHSVHAEEAVGKKTGGSGGSSSQAFETGKIEKEIGKCLLAVGGKDDEKTKKLAKGFEQAWKKLADKGLKMPTKKDREHFYAQMFHESGKFQAMSEKGNGSASVKGGSKYKGRGPLQLTHCYNYAGFARFMKAMHASKDVNELFNNKDKPQGGQCPPSDLAEDMIMSDPEGAIGDKSKNQMDQALSAIWWWEDNKKRRPDFRKAVESEDVEKVSKAVNGGTNGLAERKKLWSKIKSSGCVQ